MAHSDTVMGIMEALRICDKHTGGDIMAHRGIWTKGVSSVNNFYKVSSELNEAGKLVKGDGYFKMPDCKSEYKEHAKLLTQVLATILKFNPECKIFREYTLVEKGLRPDALVLLKRDGKGCCLVIEVCNNETEEYYQSKINAWNGWDGATKSLSALFGYVIPHFDIVKSDELKTYMEGL